jgi:hypothetical protein
MAIRRSGHWVSQLRVDVPDMRALESAVRNDFDEMVQAVITGEQLSYVLRGFEINMTGAIGNAANGLAVIVSDSAVLHTTSMVSGSIFKVPAGTPVEILSSTVNTKVTGNFSPNSTNYVSIDFSRTPDASTQAPRAIWDPTNKIETSKVLPVAQLMTYTFKITTTGFAADTLPMAIVQTDAANNVTSITDRRPMLFRLGQAGFNAPNPSYEYPWTNQSEGREETPSTSAGGLNPFHGGDKQIKSLKEWMDVVMSIFKEINGGLYWYSLGTGGSTASVRQDAINTVVTGRATVTHNLSTPGQLNWNYAIQNRVLGSRLTYAIAAYNAGTDATLQDGEVAYIEILRDQQVVPNLIFTNGGVTVTSVGAISWTTDLVAGDYIKASSSGVEGYYPIQSIDSISQVTLATPYEGVSTGPSGTTALYTYGVYTVVNSPSTRRHVKIVPREDVPLSEDLYWLFLRDDNGGSVAKVYTRFKAGELEQGESQEVSDQVSLQLLNFIGALSEADDSPAYSSNNYVTDGDSLVTAIGDLDAALGGGIGGSNQDRSMKLVGGGTWSWNGGTTELTFTTSAYVQIPGIADDRNTLLAQTITLPNAASVAYVEVNRAVPGVAGTLTVSVADVDAVTPGPNTVIIARRENGNVIIGNSSTHLKSGQSTEIYAQTSNQTLQFIGSTGTEVAQPTYSSNIRGTANESLVDRIGNLTNAMGDYQEDRSAYLRSDDPITWTGTQLQFTTDIILEILNTKGAGIHTATFPVASGPFPLADGESVWCRIDRTVSSQTPTIYFTSSLAIQPQNDNYKDTFVLFRRIDVAGTGYLHIPLHKQVIEPGQTVRLGASGSGSGSGGDGSDLATTSFNLLSSDNFANASNSVLSSIDDSAGKTDASLYSAASKYYRLAYDASKTVTGTGTSMTMSGAPTFTVKTGDVLRVGTEARRITNVATQTSYTIESAFTTNPSASAACVSQAVHTKDLNALAVDGVAPSAIFTGTISDALITYNDTTTASDTKYNNTDPALIGFTASADGSSYSSVQSREANLALTQGVTTMPTTGTNLYIRFFSNASSGSGFVNLVGYRAYFHRMDDAVEAGGIQQQAYAMLNGSATPTNCALSVVGGKTRIVTTFSFPVGVNSGTPNGAVQVRINGVKIPRYVSSTLTPDASYTEVSSNVIDLDRDYSSMALSVEVLMHQSIVDTNTTNTTSIQYIKDYAARGFQSQVDVTSNIRTATTTTGSPAAGTFHSTIANRASITDLANNLKASFGPERFQINTIMHVVNEYGPNGELVWKPVSDFRDAVRFAGTWIHANDSSGQGVYSATTNDFLEITFFGTGLNLVVGIYSAAIDIRASVDGGSETSNLWTGGTNYSNVLNSRNYSTNQQIALASGLTLGVHTVKVRLNAAVGLKVFGYEVLNLSSATSITVNPGVSYNGANKLTNASTALTAYNSDFTNTYGTPGTRGGRVLVYQAADGSIKKDIRYAGSQANLTAADHSNEEVARVIHFREFGQSSGVDFLSDGSLTNRYYVLDDGTTSLSLANGYVGISGYQGIWADNQANTHITLTFVGTGLDIMEIQTEANVRACTVSIDGGASIGTITHASSGPPLIRKIVSGLPYGTHTVRFTCSGTFGVMMSQFIIYQPKTPALPSGATEIASYNLLASYSANATAGILPISQGVIRKNSKREVTYINGTGGSSSWVVNGYDQVNLISANDIPTDRNGASYSFSFFGTGFDLRGIANTDRKNGSTVTINGLAATTANYPTLTSSQYGGWTFSAGVLNQNAALQPGAGVSIQGLPLNQYTVTVTSTNGTSTSYLAFDVADVVTPIHSYKLAPTHYILQNAFLVGNSPLSDDRKTTLVKEEYLQRKNTSYARGVTSAAAVGSTTQVPCTDLSTVHKNSTGKIKVTYSVAWRHNQVGGYMGFQVYIDGVVAGITRVTQYPGSTGAANHLIQSIDEQTFPVNPGTHKVDVYVFVSGGTGTLDSVDRQLTVEEA